MLVTLRTQRARQCTWPGGKHGAKLEGEDRRRLETALTDAKEALTGTDQERIKSTQEELKAASFKLSEALYAAQNTGDGDAGAPGQSDSGGAEGEAKRDDDVVDAEFEVN